MKPIQDEFNAISVPDIPLNAKTYELCAKHANKSMRISKALFATGIVFTVTFGTAFAFSAEFREHIISFFKSEQIETPIIIPELAAPVEADQSEEQLAKHFLGKQEIEGIAQINYFKFDNPFEIYDNTIATQTEDGQLKIYRLDDKEFIELPQYRIEGTIRINDLAIPLSFVYVIDNKIIKTFDNIYEPESGGQATAIWSAEGDFVWVNISVRYEMDTYVKYDLKTGAVQNIIGEAGVETSTDTRVSFSPDKSMIMVHDLHTAYLIDVEKAAAQELTSISTSDELSTGFIDNETLSVWQLFNDDQVRYSVYSYNIGNGEKTNIFENVPYYSPSGDSSTGIRGLGRGITVLVEPEQYVLVDEKSGIRYAIENLKPDSSIDFLLSPDRKRVAVTTSNGKNGLGITQIGYINIDKQELKVFDRKDFSENTEVSMYWLSENELAVTTRNESRYLYIYRFE